jgi:chromosome segregation ATPase
MSKSVKPIALRVEGYKRITVAEAHFDPKTGRVVAVMGENEAGKSSFLDAFEALIGGRAAPKVRQPIHKGSDEARIIGTFLRDDGVEIIVERVYRANGTTAITVRQDGLKVARAEDVLSAFYSHIAIDPLGFARLDSKAQVDTLVRLTGFDPAPLDEEHRNVFETRKEAGQKVKRLAGALAEHEQALPQGEQPTELIDVAATFEQLQQAQSEHRVADARAAAVTAARVEVTRTQERVTDLTRMLDEAIADANRAIEAETVATIAADAAERPDLAPLQEALASAESHNSAVRAVLARDAAKAAHVEAVAEHKALDARLDDIAARKRAGFAGVDMPVDGLTIEEGEVYLDGTPFSQTSPGGKLRTSTLIAVALNPDLRAIVIRDGALLDDANRKLIADVAAERDYLVLMELVGDGADHGIVFEGGAIVEVRR